MSAITVARFDRRDAVDRVDVHAAALAYTKAARAQPGVLSSRFFWEMGYDTVVVINEYETTTAMMSQPGDAVGSAYFRLADVGRPTGLSRLIDARDAAANYQAIGRA